MPIGQVETHPYLEEGYIVKAKKLILGSFPVYECTNDDNQLKYDNRNLEHTVRFFYGSVSNSLWNKYSEYVDQTIVQPWDKNRILASLNERKIAISDTIISCERYKLKRDPISGIATVVDEYSSEDSALRNIIWNKQMIRSLITGGVTKILCTSKGVLQSLKNQIICDGIIPFGIEDPQQSAHFQEMFINAIQGNLNQIVNPVARIFNVEGQSIAALAIPSPGSPQRQTHTFGCGNQNRLGYANAYFQNAFNWLLEP